MCILVQLISKYGQKQNTPMDYAFRVRFLSFLFLFCVIVIYNPVDLFGAFFENLPMSFVPEVFQRTCW